MRELQRGAFRTVGELRKLLEGVPDEAIILTQVKGTDSIYIWMMHPTLSGPLEHFKWEAPVLCLSIEHPDLKVLPKEVFTGLDARPAHIEETQL